jgi:hypothetical protein
LLAKADADTWKNTVCPEVAMAFASYKNIYKYLFGNNDDYLKSTIVFPVPGGPNINTPSQGRLIPYFKCKGLSIYIFKRYQSDTLK